MEIDRQKTPFEEAYDRMAQVIAAYGGKAPAPNEAGSLELYAEFCWALDVKPIVHIVPNEQKP